MSRNQVGRQKGFESEFRLKVLQYKQEHPLSCTQTAITGLRREYKLAALLLLVSSYNSSWDLGAIYRKSTTNTGVIYFLIRPKIILYDRIILLFFISYHENAVVTGDSGIFMVISA